MASTEYQTEDFSQDPAGESTFNDGTLQPVEQQSNGGQKSASDNRINASKHVEDGTKLFVGGLSWETSDKSMKDYFSQYGTVTEVEIKREPGGQSRGFAFVMFEDPSSVQAVLNKTDHVLDEKIIDAKIARALKKDEPVVENKKIFVGGLAPGSTVEVITEFFTTYGEVEEVVLPEDKQTRRKRGFGFVTFKEQSSVEKVMASGTGGQKSYVTLDGHQVEVKPAVPRDQQDSMKAQRSFRGRGRGGGAGFRGGYSNQGGDYYNSGNYGYGGGAAYNTGYNDGSYNYDSYNNSYGSYSGYQDQSYGGQAAYGGGGYYEGYNNQTGYNQGYGQGYDVHYSDWR
ncbi:heterogeneous nuclear ribonucleoprotein A/B-like isoform X2 [Antedon mediterranea]|uniref:heterogeneous nuclear ribonucleoprotein A/B-like isoform X2 n=1 Tax=Antedon mediterranea TaxID=105859 RepID=UPI003AF94E4C